ncbi:MAG: diguanylate cyclase [Candidatus Aminicenantes bacterium]|nr:diguanylate cyclase [Candidatus Aminicenantes bacterium]
MKKQIFPLLASAALVLAVPLLSQVLPFEVFNLKQGIPQSQVTALAQDHDGYLWVGTWGGLARFNGSEFKSFFIQDGLRSSRIQELLAASNGTVWVATDGGLSRWQDHRLEMLDDPAVGTIPCLALAEDARNRVWIGSENGVAVFAEGKFSVFHPGGVRNGPRVYDILADREGILVAADNGIWRFPWNGPPLAVPGPAGIATDNYRALALTAEGLWLGTYSHGVWRRNDSGWEAYTDKTAAAKSVYQMSVQASGTLYISTNGSGLLIKRPGQAGMEHWGTDNGLPSNVINTVLEDREGSLWITTYIGGLARLSSMAWISHTEKQGLPSACVFGISPGDTADSLWLGTMRGAVHYQVRPLPKVLEIVRAKDGLGNDWVWKVLRTPNGTLWFMTDTTLRYRLHGERTIRELSPDLPIPRTVPWDMTVDGQGNFWVCGSWSSGGLARRDAEGRWKKWDRTPAGEPLTDVSRVVRRRRGGVWIAAKNASKSAAKSSLHACDGETLTMLAAPCPLSNAISTICEDSSGRLWAGSDDGLAVLETDGRWRLLNDRPGFSNHHVFFIGEDWKGKIWVNTARGVFRFLADYKAEGFTPDDGLADWETNGNGFYSDARGEIWIGTVNGLSQYNPASFSRNTEPPRLMIENVRLPSRSLEFPKQLDLAWNERTLIFNIAVLSYRNRNRSGYVYRLDGLENEWNPLSRLADLRYTNLPDGDLKLQLKPVNESGVWGETVVLPIHVRPPFWMTLWFRLGGALFLLAAALGIHRWRTMLLRRRNRELESEVGKRTAKLEYLATYDPLTALLNRRAILAFLERQLRPERGSNRQLGCIMIDLNRFKAVNDTLGHAAGDQVLKEMAAKIQECLRQGDALGRLGGDEFLVVLPGADMEALQAVTRRINDLVCRAGEGDAAITVTASCGALAVPAGSAAAAAAVLAQADDLLYQVKRAGRQDFVVAAFKTESAKMSG